MGSKHDPRLPKITSSEETFKLAKDTADLLEYYAYLLRDPETTALEICGVPEISIDNMLMELYKRLVTADTEIHAILKQEEPEIVIPN